MTATSPVTYENARSTLDLVVLLRREEGGRTLAIERVTDRDLADARAEAWFETCPRRGRPDVPRESMVPALFPVHRETEGGPRYCAGFDLELPGPGGEPARTVFSRMALEPVARRGARELVRRGDLESEAKALWELRAEPPAETSSLAASSVGAAVRATRGGGEERLRYRTLPLPPLLERAEARGPVADGDASGYPVLYTRGALAKAERVSRKGGEETRPVETGGLLVGTLCACPATGEMFAVVLDVLEARHSQATTYSLSYSGATWSRIQTLMGARCSHPATRSHRILGQCHGHSFLPLEGAPPCADCSRRDVCSRTTAFLSADDLSWCRAVFHGEPWQLSHVFGWNARNEAVDAFFGQRGGVLAARGYHVIDDFPAEDS